MVVKWEGREGNLIMIVHTIQVCTGTACYPKGATGLYAETERYLSIRDGGGQPYGISNEVRRLRMEGLYQEDHDKALRCSHENPGIRQIYSEFLGAPGREKAEQLLHTKYKARKAYLR